MSQYKMTQNKMGAPMIYERINEHQTRLFVDCPCCRKKQSVVVNSQDYYNWTVKGEAVQNAFPYLSPDEREMLLTGICNDCFPKDTE